MVTNFNTHVFNKVRLPNPIVLLSILLWMSTMSYSMAETTEATQHRVASDNLRIEKIAPNVWVHISRRELDNGQVFPANGLLIQDGDSLIMVDTPWGEDLTTELIAWVNSEIGLPIDTAIASHFHDDSMSGTSILREAGVRVLANPLTIELGKNHSAAVPEPLTALETNNPTTVGNIEVFFPGAGHSADNIFVWVPEAELLFGGCSVRSPDFPGLGNTHDADMQNWPIAIKRVQNKYSKAKIVVPGHGSIADQQLLSYTWELFTKNQVE